MLRFNHIRYFLYRFLLVYTLFVMPWPYLGKTYRACFEAVVSFVFISQDNRNLLSFASPPGNRSHSVDERIIIANEDTMRWDGSGPIRNLDFDVVGFGWRPTALLIALIAATPITWRRRKRVIWLALLLQNCYILLSLALVIRCEAAHIGRVPLTPSGEVLTQNLEYGICDGLNLLAPVVIWVVLSFRKSDLNNLIVVERPTHLAAAEPNPS